MSRTDKDRPYRIKVTDETLGSYVRHDHTRGYCEIAPKGETRWSIRGRYNHNCNKVLRGTLYCTKQNPLSTRQYIGYYYGSPTCWRSYAVWEGKKYFSNWHWESVQCEGHSVVTRDTQIPCKCDDWPPMAMCDYTVPDPYYISYREGGVPKWYVDRHWNNPERVRTRDELKKAAALYNGGEWDDEDDFDFDFPNYQHRHRAGWHYW